MGNSYANCLKPPAPGKSPAPPLWRFMLPLAGIAAAGAMAVVPVVVSAAPAAHPVAHVQADSSGPNGGIFYHA